MFNLHKLKFEFYPFYDLVKKAEEKVYLIIYLQIIIKI
jgi:hypothetical protein